MFGDHAWLSCWGEPQITPVSKGTGGHFPLSSFCSFIWNRERGVTKSFYLDIKQLLCSKVLGNFFLSGIELVTNSMLFRQSFSRKIILFSSLFKLFFFFFPTQLIKQTSNNNKKHKKALGHLLPVSHQSSRTRTSRGQKLITRAFLSRSLSYILLIPNNCCLFSRRWRKRTCPSSRIPRRWKKVWMSSKTLSSPHTKGRKCDPAIL